MQTACVLVATHIGLEPEDVLRRACALCDVLESKLFILRVASPAGRLAWRATRDAAEIAARTTLWCETVLGEGIPNSRILVRHDDFGTAVGAAAQRVGAILTVVPSSEAMDGDFVTCMVRRTGIPVLLACPPHGKHTVVAATDFSDGAYPVLGLAQRLARGVAAPSVFMHNVAPVGWSDVVVGAARHSAEGFVAATVLRHRIAGLERAARGLRAGASRVVAVRPDTARAILDVGRRTEADLIVVGTHVDRKMRRNPRRTSVAADVVNQAPGRSVLVVPVGMSQ